MRIQIKDLVSGEVYDIGPNGATLGRESARTDIAIPDEAISKKHARILLIDDQWFLEDLNSSNGTFVDANRISEQTPLYPNMSFSLSQRSFQVVDISGDQAPAENPNRPQFYGPDSDIASHLSEQGDEPPPLLEPQDSAANLSPNTSKLFLAGLAKSVAYYLKVLPLMMVHPIGFVRRGINEQPWPAMNGPVLLAYALPAFILCSLTSTLSAAIATMITSDLGFTLLKNGIIMGVLIGLTMAVAFAFLWHPIVGAIIRLLGGDSNAHARSNYALMYFAGSIFIALSVNSAHLFNLLPLSFAVSFSPFLLVLGTITMAYLIHSWNKFFDIANWARHTILALLVLSVIGATFNFGNAVHASVLSMYGPSTTNEQPPSNTPSNDNITTSTSSGPENNTAGDKNKSSGPAIKGRAPGDVATDTKQQPTKPEETANYAQQQEAASIQGATDFVTFLNKRNAIEEAIKNNPMLIRNAAIVRDYSRIWKRTYQLREKYRKKKGKRFERDRIFSRQKDADIYDATHKIVDRLYERIIKR